MSPWRPISDGFPPRGQFVLIRFDDGTCEVAAHNEAGWYANDGLDFEYGTADQHVTHWCELPEFPK